MSGNPGEETRLGFLLLGEVTFVHLSLAVNQINELPQSSEASAVKPKPQPWQLSDRRLV